PQIGVEIAVVSSVAVTTQVKAAWSPSRALMMTGRGLETTVEASIDTNMPRMRPDRASSTRRCSFFSTGASDDAGDGVDMRSVWECANGGAATTAQMVDRYQPLRRVNYMPMVDGCQPLREGPADVAATSSMPRVVRSDRATSRRGHGSAASGRRP